MPALTSIKEAMSSFRQMGTLLPTQTHLAHSIARTLPRRNGLNIVELGAGEGSITRAIVRELGKLEYRLLAVELNETLLRANRQALASRFNGSAGRVVFVQGDAFGFGRILEEQKMPNVDVVVSTLPLYYFPPNRRKGLFAMARERLGEAGMYVQYRYTPDGLDELRPYFSRIQRRFVLNLMPAWLFVCDNQENGVTSRHAWPGLQKPATSEFNPCAPDLNINNQESR
jgi:phosphatidylethanolamine/phosphatidyl-N-methylethanolamine N-methyltransferase